MRGRHGERLRRRAAAAAGLTALALAASGCATAPPAPNPPHRPDLESLLDRAVAQGFSGQVLVADRTTILFEATPGLADRDRAIAHHPEEIWRWASVSKQVVALIAMREVEAHRLDLDAPIARVLPRLAGSPAGAATARQLLQHTAGLPNPDDTAPDASGLPAFYRDPGPLGDSVPSLCAGPAKRPAGERFEYNNCDTLVLAAALGTIESLPFDALVRREVGLPLGLATLRMGRSSVPVEATGVDAAGKAVPLPRIENFGASAGLEGSARDLLAFDRALLDHALLSDDATRQMWTGDPALGYVALGAWSFSAPLKGCAGPVALVERRGDVAGIQVRNILAPARGTAVIVFTNAADFEFGEVWQGTGFTHDLLSAALCGAG